jgi:undecaprenyl-phosphate 4-deoxy-4-formamido-L-arabinose transferase
VLEGLRHARGDCSVTLDDDLQNPLAEAVRLAQRLRSCDAEVVYGRYTTKQHHWLRNAGSRAVNALASFLLNKPRTLYLSSFRALRRELSARIIEYRGPYPHIDSLILNATNRITQLDVTHFPRAHGRSGYTTRKLLRLAMNLCFDSSVMPLRIASVLGALLCCAGGVLLGEVFVEELTVGRVQPGWASLMGALAAFSGAQLLMLGLIGEYVGRAFLTVSGKPQSHLRTVHRHQSEL